MDRGVAPKMPREGEQEWVREIDRASKFFVSFVERWPNFRRHAAFGLLGNAIAIADTMGLDVEGFLAELRRRHARPDVMAPPGAEPLTPDWSFDSKDCAVCTLVKQADELAITREEQVSQVLAMGGLLVAVAPAAFRRVITSACEKHRRMLAFAIGNLAANNGLDAAKQEEKLGFAVIVEPVGPDA